MPNHPPRPSPDAADVCAELREFAGGLHAMGHARNSDLCCRAAAAIESLRALVAGAEWVSVEEQLPEGDETVLAVTKYGVDPAYVDDGMGWMHLSGKPFMSEVTHWRPLPAPPPVASEGEARP